MKSLKAQPMVYYSINGGNGAKRQKSSKLLMIVNTEDEIKKKHQNT